jgi:hypothetical protein
MHLQIMSNSGRKYLCERKKDESHGNDNKNKRKQNDAQT